MKSIIQQIAHKNREREASAARLRQAEIAHPSTGDNRRNFLKKTALGGMSIAGLVGIPFEDVMAQTTSKVQKASAPSELKITDLRYCVTTVLGRTAIIRIDTNQGIYGLGEVRDGASKNYALMLKRQLIGVPQVTPLDKTLTDLARLFRPPGQQSGHLVFPRTCS